MGRTAHPVYPTHSIISCHLQFSQLLPDHRLQVLHQQSTSLLPQQTVNQIAQIRISRQFAHRRENQSTIKQNNVATHHPVFLTNKKSTPERTYLKILRRIQHQYLRIRLLQMAYRNTVGKVYEEVHRKLADNLQERAALKLKLFFCHIINRVFSGSVNPTIFPYYTAWLKRN